MKYIVTINSKNYEVEVEKGVAQILAVADVAAPSPVAPVALPVAAPAVPAVMPTYAPAQPVSGDVLPAPMPGQIVSVLKKEGDIVKTGDVVLIMEAMKMENEIVATRSGMITKVFVSKGTTVTTGDPLVTVG